MPYLRWSDDLRIGVAEVDEQHQTLVSLINALHDAMSEGRGKDVLASTISGLIDYTVTHFATEEAHFERHGYPERATHKLRHEAFVKQVADFKQGFDEDRLMLSLDVMDFLGTWLVEHIQREDKAFAPYLNAHGVA